ncbi:MAG: nucleotidyl transferase AbiEii/AbiGii toxin family protein [Candidatus Aminicenantes bacterium]|nr:nucleotidyl transferase AbiEii/AbiGii toxin family protein [Candidatus Aminicenantes bacterium]
MIRENIVEVLETQLARLLKCNILPQNSYLAGGTAVYFYLKHRVSVDLDFFTPKNFNIDAFVHGIKQCFAEVHVELMEKHTLILYISKQKIKFSLFFFPYEPLHKITSYTLRNDITCPLASLQDLEAMKAIAISQRGSAKDFIDLYFLLKETNHQYDDILRFVMEKYHVEKEYEYQLKTSFIYFDDAEKEIDSIVMIKDRTAPDVFKAEKIKEEEWEKIKAFFKEFIK